MGFFLFYVPDICSSSFKEYSINRFSEQTKSRKNLLTSSKAGNQITKLISMNIFAKEFSKDFGKSDIYLKLIANADKENQNIYQLDIESDIQYQKGNIFFAEGDVKFTIDNAIVRGDKTIYDKTNKTFKIIGNVTFQKGSQYFEASELFFNFEENKGYILNVYGLLDFKKFADDLNLNNFNALDDSQPRFDEDDINNINYVDAGVFGFSNQSTNERNINIKDLNFSLPEISVWRFKAKKLHIGSNKFSSKDIYFTNDIYNPPQFILQSKNFTGEILDEKINLRSKNSWIILENKLKVPIGNRSIIDRDPWSKWGIGSDYKDKDGFYISRGLSSKKLSDNFNLRITPYILFQRAIQGSTNAYRGSDKSILDNTQKLDAEFFDYFAIDANVSGKIKNWDLELNNSLSTLNLDRFSEAYRSKFLLYKTKDRNQDKSKLEKEINYFTANNDDFQIYASYRENIERAFEGDQEIYLGKGIKYVKRKSKDFDKDKFELSWLYDLGEFTAEAKNNNKLKTLTRNAFVTTLRYTKSIWNKGINKNIDSSYKYTPEVINQRIDWISSLDAGLFLYSNDNAQKVIKLKTGPKVVLGDFSRNFLSYTSLGLEGNYIFKEGESSFLFDDISPSTRVSLNLGQQIIGPLVFNYASNLNLDTDHSDYGKIVNPKYELSINRRAYSLSLYYEEDDENVGFQFKIYNFDYDGKPNKF
ncbi:DUF3769 domain-containing protein [Prochlorococcus sp. AH-716-O10]|nr:DUF3769 domain-containing protein [Prochlorococcus sp. AH-716-O10]